MPLYKYVCPERTDILENGMIRFTQPMYFNDHFDTRITMKRFLNEEDNKRFFEHSKLDNINNNIDQVIQQYNIGQVSDYDLLLATMGFVKEQFVNPNWLIKKVMLEIYYSELNQLIGILCLTTNSINKKMWGNYANENSGFALVFDERHPFFNNAIINDPEAGKLHKINYSAKPIIPDNIRSEEMKLALFNKDDAWIEESEWRMILPLDKATKVEGEIHLFKFPPEIITGVIFGLRTEERTINIIKTLCGQDRYKHVKLYQVRAIEDSYELKVEDYK